MSQNIVLTSFQNKCVIELVECLENKKRHCSFVIPVGCGKTHIAYKVGDELSYCFNVIYIFSSRLVCENFKDRFSNVSSYTVSDIKKGSLKYVKDNKPILFILIDCNTSELLYLQNILNNFYTLSLSSENRRLLKDPSSSSILSFVSIKENEFPAAIVCTKIAIDYCIASLYEDIDKLKIITNEKFGRNRERRMVYADGLPDKCCVRRKKIKKDFLMCVVDFSNSGSQNAVVAKEKKKDSSKSRRKDIAYEIINNVFKRMGIPTDEALDFVAKMQDIKANSCESDADNEQRAKQIQEMAYSALFECFAKQFDSSVVADKCAYDFGQKTWKSLLPNAKKAIVSGIATFNFISHTPSKEYYDYSGVCMLISKAVELELELYLHANYIKYLQSIFGDDLSKYPKPLVFTKNGQNSLGYFSLEHASRIVKYNVGGVEKYDDVFLDYAKKHLYKRASDETIKANIDEICNFAETVRVSYRNRAAHKDKLDYDTMDNCLQYVVYVQKMLKVVVDKFSPITL